MSKVGNNLSNDLSYEQQQAAGVITECYQILQSKNSNVVREILPIEPIYSWQHYPAHDIKDVKNHCQYYYHSHPSKDHDRVPDEHGHFHLFYRKNILPKDAVPVIVSKKYTETAGSKDNLTHIFAIAVNEFGLPVSLFTVNFWVVLGVWYEADILIDLLDRFLIDIPESPYAVTNRWLTHMVRLFKPYIADLLRKRDQVICDAKSQCSASEIYYSQDLEITSILRLQ